MEVGETTEEDPQKTPASINSFQSWWQHLSCMPASFCFLLNMASSSAVHWRRRVVQSDDHRERWLITLVAMPVLWPWPPLLNQTGSVNVQVNGACLGDVWNKPVLPRKGSSAHNISLRCSVLPLCHAGPYFIFALLLSFDEHVKCNESHREMTELMSKPRQGISANNETDDINVMQWIVTLFLYYEWFI